ncbi:MAG: hypothetical protein Q8O32_00040, partial [bacterium]|nr:hypothetical protein [bacterium]
MPKEINKDLASPSPENAENDLEIFANRRIAELTARVTNLKELWRAQSKESLPVGENFDKEISQIEQTLADFEVSVRDKLKADGEGFPEAQKKGAIEILTKESVKKIKSLESNMGLNAPKQADKKLDANTPETQSGASEFTFTDLKEYEQMAYSSVFEAIGSVKDKKIAKLLREKYDNFLATAKELVVDNKLGNEEKPKLVEEKFQEFLTEIGNIVDKEQVDPQESVEVTMQEAKPQSPKAVASLDESLPVDKDAVVSDKDNGEKASGDVENKKSEESIKEADKEALSEPEEAKENPETIRERLIAFVNEKIDSLTIEVDALYAELSSQADGEEKIVYLDNINNILEIKAEQIVEDDSMSFEQRQKEIEISFQEFKEKLKVIREGGEIGLPKPEEDKKIAKGKKFKKVIENIAKFGKGTKELAKTKEGRGFLVKTAYDTVSTVFGIKFATDLALVVVGKGDIYNYLKQKGEVRKEKSSIKESLAKGEKAKVKEIIEASKNISSEEKKVLLDRLESLDQEYATKGKELEEEKQDRVQETLNAYIQNKTKGAKIARDALNTAFMATGLGAFRGGAYLLGSMAERMQKASTKHDKERFVLEDEESEEAKTQEAKVNFILRDLVVSSTVETFRSLVGKGKTKESEHK